MPKLAINKSISIKSAVEPIFQKLNDFNHWTAWSPWLIMDPDATVNVDDDAKSYTWEGKRVGEGKMQITSESEGKSIDYDLTFLKPWKSEAKVRFEFEPMEDETKVTWSMDSSLPFYLFWMKKMMTAFVGMDYERGLNLLKEYIEDGEVHSKLEFKGVSEFPATKYVGIKTNCKMADVGDAMKADFGKLADYVHKNLDNATGQSFSIYHKWDMVKGQVQYTAAFGLKEPGADLPAEMFNGEIPATKINTVRHHGPYHHLGNAWSTQISMSRGKEFKQKKNIHPFESYVNNPEEVSEKELMTDVNFPMN